MPYSPRRRAFLADMVRFTAALPVMNCSLGMAQQRVPRIGFISGAERSLVSAFEDEMRKLGYSAGGNIRIETRLGRANTNDAAAHTAELATMDLDFVVLDLDTRAFRRGGRAPKKHWALAEEIINAIPGQTSDCRNRLGARKPRPREHSRSHGPLGRPVKGDGSMRPPRPWPGVVTAA